MKGIDISNIKIKNLEPIDFYHNPSYKMFGVGSEFSTLVPWYKEKIQEVLGSKVNENLEDYELTTTETQALKIVGYGVFIPSYKSLQNV